MSNIFSDPYREVATREVTMETPDQESTDIMVARANFIRGLLFDTGIMGNTQAAATTPLGVNQTTTIIAIAQLLGSLSVFINMDMDVLVNIVLNARRHTADELTKMMSTMSTKRGAA